MKKFEIKEKDVRSILNRFRWDPAFDFNLVEVFYIDRPKGISSLSGSEIEEIGYKFIYLQDAAIPVHRVVEIRYDGMTVWRKGHECGKKQA
ncbi:DUF504 domain-containing protein [Archaeoglobus veneficus]|uniref:UPF0248 protein Arcve_0271 n=1 Tax=Archaeoglobus veneficus (strain DSM 11195 / SNP6) TaxID=693661 RepID=F2KNZ8_ARCVS|nr:RNA repair domain-containing protein [Archaeoglobus veneficus]AEA46306.1 UPF0248 protein [Archaeoglobus veneficus SNP6]